jgi:DNA-binding CsgD family transcriptional regulator
MAKRTATDDQILALIDQGKSYAYIQAHLSVSPSRISVLKQKRLKSKLDLKARARIRLAEMKAEQKGRSKDKDDDFTPEQLAEMKKMGDQIKELRRKGEI